jgi:colicin import membrane protein
MRNVPKKPRTFIAALLAVSVHVALALFLIFGVQWQNKYSEPMMVEVVAPMPHTQTPPPPQPVVKPPPEPPPPAPPPPPKPPTVPPVVPPPAPPPVKADPKPVAKPEPAKVDIALKARQEKERLDKQKREQDRLAQEKREREVREIAKKEADKREREVREAAKREADRRSLEELKLAQDRARQEAEDRQRREAQAQREREQRQQLAAQQAAAKAATDKAQAAAAKADADYVNRIQAKIRGNVVLPPDIAGNPEGIFDVVQLPTGEIISAEIRKSSGSRIYDDAVLRAILKSSPLPKPDTPELFQRNLRLTFRPKE